MSEKSAYRLIESAIERELQAVFLAMRIEKNI